MDLKDYGGSTTRPEQPIVGRRYLMGHVPAFIDNQKKIRDKIAQSFSRSVFAHLRGIIANMKLSNQSEVPVYTISGSNTARPLPEWLARRRKRSLKNDPEYANRIELLQDFEFEEASQCVRVSEDGEWVMSTGETILFFFFFCKWRTFATDFVAFTRNLQTSNPHAPSSPTIAFLGSPHRRAQYNIPVAFFRLLKIYSPSV